MSTKIPITSGEGFLLYRDCFEEEEEDGMYLRIDHCEVLEVNSYGGGPPSVTVKIPKEIADEILKGEFRR